MTGDPLELNDEINSKYQHALLNTDYQNLAKKQKEFETAMRDHWVEVTTPEGTNIKFQIGDRPVTKQDGDASKQRSMAAKNLIDREVELPAGAIRVAPIEETVEGIIAFPDSDWGGTMVKGLQMVFKSGKVVGIAADEGTESVKRILDEAGDAGYSFREFAVGFNPELAIPDTEPKWIPYYGYGAGVVRLSLGDNTELGGKVSGPFVRWNFFTNASLKVGDDVWVKDGKLIR
ncbi:MAG: aminopeptidase [Flammeovirgaceae bacterium]|nr:aminopeptidase [Flammeovirgaceae bacterium]